MRNHSVRTPLSGFGWYKLAQGVALGIRSYADCTRDLDKVRIEIKGPLRKCI